jgi:hypothetical protein
MNDYEKTIEVLQNRVRALEQLIQPVNAVSEPVKWQPKGGNFFIQSNGRVSEAVGSSDTPHKEFGVERPTRQQAERALVEMRRFNRLLALRDGLCGDDVMDWKSSNTPKYFLVYNAFENVWDLSAIHKSFVTPCFKTEEQARLACNMLNMGEVEL